MRCTAWLLATGLSFGLSGFTHAEVFRCSDGETVQYSDTPCGDQAERITLQDDRIGGRFDSNLPPVPESKPEENEPETTEAATPQPPASPCRYIPSTDLRRYLIREQVVVGMTRDNVLEAFGRPPETYPVPQETWVYTTDYYGLPYELTYVYFRDGCVENVVYRKP